MASWPPSRRSSSPARPSPCRHPLHRCPLHAALLHGPPPVAAPPPRLVLRHLEPATLYSRGPTPSPAQRYLTSASCNQAPYARRWSSAPPPPHTNRAAPPLGGGAPPYPVQAPLPPAITAEGPLMTTLSHELHDTRPPRGRRRRDRTSTAPRVSWPRCGAGREGRAAASPPPRHRAGRGRDARQQPPCADPSPGVPDPRVWDGTAISMTPRRHTKDPCGPLSW
uniref:Uncharacterized protein n=1 Tax=Setaria viridis TaxID=4556 RepID=A0A4U6VNY4_SETVI|nr:hypothetical protein SEVIR_2G063232v2 [Setaria viridis]